MTAQPKINNDVGEREFARGIQARCLCYNLPIMSRYRHALAV
jgi:hypothetical protein